MPIKGGVVSASEFLAHRFPLLQFAGAAGRFIEQCNERDIAGQLSDRRISWIARIPLTVGSKISIGEDSNFCVCLDKSLAVSEWPKFLGHEVGRTFHYNLTHSPPTNYLDYSRLFFQVQDFYHYFSILWLEKNSPEDIIRYIRNQTRPILASSKKIETAAAQ